MASLSSMITRSVATAVVTASALGGCAMMCRACGGRRCGAQAATAAGGCHAGGGACKACAASKPACAASMPGCGASH